MKIIYLKTIYRIPWKRDLATFTLTLYCSFSFKRIILLLQIRIEKIFPYLNVYQGPCQYQILKFSRCNQKSDVIIKYVCKAIKIGVIKDNLLNTIPNYAINSIKHFSYKVDF